jgi:hypothetical protein
VLSAALAVVAAVAVSVLWRQAAVLLSEVVAAVVASEPSPRVAVVQPSVPRLLLLARLLPSEEVLSEPCGARFNLIALLKSGFP